MLDKHEIAAKHTNNVIVQASFAHKALSEKGYADKTHLLPVPLDHKNFHKLDADTVSKIKSKNGISQDDFIIGFVFRNQLRKSVPNLLEGFKRFTQEHPESNAKLLLHTHWAEGWDISKLIAEKEINPASVLTTYFCKDCRNYEIKSFQGQDLDCKFCGSKKSQQTTQIQKGVSEKQLNEIYNLMDVYCHPFTSGGQEIPIQEAKLTELITLVTNYSCGEEMCQSEAASLPLSWSEYREHGTEFIKASTKPNSICSQLTKVYKMKPKQKELMGKQARQWVVDNFSTEAVCKIIEDFIDNSPEIDYKFDFLERRGNPNYVMPEIEEDSEWVLHMYANILNYDSIDKDDDGYKHWMSELKQGKPRQDVEQYFRNIAAKENASKVSFEDLLDPNDKGKRILYCMPRSAGDIFLSTSLFKSIKETYPDHNLYVATSPEFFDILDGNEHVHKVLAFNDAFENHHFTEGSGENEGHFEISFIPHITTQKFQSYQHNGKDIINYKDLKYAHN
mgnify:CR=1 FL=1